MATAATLEQAAGQAFDNLYAKWVAGTAKTNLVAFAAAALPVFPESEPASHPISNWAAVIGSSAAVMPNGNSFTFVNYDLIVAAANYLYRMCWMASKLETQTSITTAQGVALLAAYNAAF